LHRAGAREVGVGCDVAKADPKYLRQRDGSVRARRREGVFTGLTGVDVRMEDGRDGGKVLVRRR
jgi:hypothetical protein